MNTPLFYQCVVMENDDPLMLGRVRARLLTDNYVDIIRGIDNPPWNEEKDKWTERDPFIFNPLLPYFLYQVPKVEELIQILYYNKEFKYQNQFYVQSMFSTPTASSFEYFVGSQKFTGIGIQYKNPTPIKNQDGTYKNPYPKGVFPEPGDNAVLGRNSADLIVKEDEVLLRAGKIYGDLQPNKIPQGNPGRAYVQLSRFDNLKQLDSVKNYTELINEVVLVKYLIEWFIVNPENTQNKFTGTVYLYQLKPDTRANSKELTIDSQVDDLKTLASQQNFNALSKEDTVKFINNFINECNSKNKIDGVRVFNREDTKFPIFYRPNKDMFSKMNSNPSITDVINPELIASKNIQEIYNLIKLNNSTVTKGYGLIYAKDKVGTPFTIKKSKVPIYKVNNNPITFGALGADKVFLLSNYSAIPGKQKINFDGTLYGITNDNLTQDILPNTSSMVRGEELLELLNLIVRFLVTHTHAYPGMAPVPVTQDGSTVSSILSELQNAVNKILNTNIRLN